MKVGWLIDPSERTCSAIAQNKNLKRSDEPDQIVPVPSFANESKLTVQELFAWLLE